MDSANRFSDRVADYIKYRPGYPASVFDTLVAEGCLTSQSVVADLGSGTGILSAEFLVRGNIVFGVEPNAAMREAAESLLGSNANFRSVDGSAEMTTLPDASVDLIVAGQAFHWFDIANTRTECLRIIRPGGVAALLWNDREIDSTPFLAAYEQLLLDKGTDYAAVDHKNVTTEQLAAFFGNERFQVRAFPNEQQFDWDGLYGRAMSSSYVPQEGDARHPVFTRGLKILFEQHAEDGHVTVRYQTRIYFDVIC
jgi:SAM-dependent methyltransferase